MAPKVAETSAVPVSNLISLHSDSASQLLRGEAAAKRLGISIHSLRRMAYARQIASHKIRGRLLFHVEEIDRVIAESRRPRAEERQQSSAAA